MTPDSLDALADAVAEAVAALPSPRAYTLERLGRVGWAPVPGELSGLIKALDAAANLSIAVNAAYRIVSPVGRVMAVYSSGDLVSVPLVIP